MTDAEFTGRFLQLLKNRLGGKAPPPDLLALEEMGPTAWNEPQFRELARRLLRQLPPPPHPLPGSCTYIVGGRTFCIRDVSPSDCAMLAGAFSESNACDPALPPYP
jgi:hypothetical protein